MTPPTQAEQVNDTPRRLIRAVFQWWKSGLVFFVVFFTILMLLAYNLPASYTAKATVLVKSGRENAPEGTATTSEAVKLTASAEDVISEINIMLSRPVLEAVANDLENENSRELVDPKTGFGASRLNFQNWCRRIGLLTGPQLPNGKFEWEVLRDYPEQVRQLINDFAPVINDSINSGAKLKDEEIKPLAAKLYAVQENKKSASIWKSHRQLFPIVEVIEDAFSELEDGDSLSLQFVSDFNTSRSAWTDQIDRADEEHGKIVKYMHERAIQKLGKLLSIEIIPATHVLEISFEHESKNTSAKTIQFLLNNYLIQHTKIHADGRWNPKTGTFELTAGEFFQKQSDNFKDKVNDIQQQITTFRKENDGGDLSKQRDLLVEELITADQSWRALDAIKGGDEELAAASVVESPEIAFYHQRLLDLRLELAKIKLQYSDVQHPDVREAEALVGAARSELVEQIKRKRDFLKRRVKNLREELKDVEENRAHYEALIELRNTAQESWKKYSAKAEEERINNALDLQQVTNLKVLEWPEIPDKPSFPNRFMMALLGIFLGIPSGLAVTLLRAYFHSRISSVSDVETLLQLPVISSIGRFARWKRDRAFADGLPSVVLDAGRMVLTSLEGTGSKVIHLASSTAGEGSGTLAAAAALISSQDNKKVVFVTEAGFPAVLSGTEGVEILQIGGLELDAKRNAIAESRDNADLVIIAGPSLASTGGGGMWASLADASVFVVSGAGVHIEVARRGVSILHRYSPMVVGAVLTQRENVIPRFIYKSV